MKQKILTLLTGAFMGMILVSGGYAAANTVLTASPSTQTFYLNGQKVEFEAYAIHGNNFVKLRDIAKAVDFGVAYDAATNSVNIDPNAHYQEEAPSVQATPSPTALTEESVQATIRALLDTYPTNSYYGDFYRSYSNGPYGMAPTHCAGWATLCSDAAFGDLPWRRINNPSWEDIRAGDLIRYDNSYGGHVVVVLNKTDEYILTTESGANNKARWGGQYYRWWLEQRPGYTCFTRYPQ